ncbi:hypothetical protein J5N97_020091 [Dioscorea zingiberensis]|uniref:adenylate kinase n=1 Tax=Dioscorea zingiberensis TaxID=325984 RepID=A0A9D5CG97_9LILI|nr:hypothetical protein J5N97_020091 [Dioscorea zingiberensis]
MKYGLVHISARDLLRAEVEAGTENGKRAKEHMEKGIWVPDKIVVLMVKERLLKPDAQQNCCLLDGYPRSFSQGKVLEDLGIRPDNFILLDADGNATKEDIFDEIDNALSTLLKRKLGTDLASKTAGLAY